MLKKKKMNVLKESLLDFFSVEDNFNTLYNLICIKPIQPRLIDFFITQRCKCKIHFFYSTDKGIPYGLTDIYSDYKLNLKGYHKKYFNMFDKKSKKIDITYKDKYLQLSIAKLNIFRWLIKNKILDVVQENVEMYMEEYHEYRKKIQSSQRKNNNKSTQSKSLLLKLKTGTLK